MSSRRSSLREGSFHLRKRLHVWFRECWPAFAKRKRARTIGEPEGRGTCFGWGSRRNRNPGAAGRRRGGGAAHPNEVRAANNRQNYASDSLPPLPKCGNKVSESIQIWSNKLVICHLGHRKMCPLGVGGARGGWLKLHKSKCKDTMVVWFRKDFLWCGMYSRVLDMAMGGSLNYWLIKNGPMFEGGGNVGLHLSWRRKKHWWKQMCNDFWQLCITTQTIASRGEAQMCWV